MLKSCAKTLLRASVLALVLLLFMPLARADRPMPKSITLSETELTLDLARDASFTLSASVSPEGSSTNFKWTSTNESVLSVEDGVISAKAPGSADVSVRVHGNYNVIAVCHVTVIDSRTPERLVVYPSSIEAEPSRRVQLYSVALPQTAGSEVVYQSSNPAVATVNESGLVEIVGPGRATISVTSAYNDKLSAQISVRAEYGERIREIRIAQSSLNLVKGQSAQLELSLTPVDGSRALVFSSSDDAVASVDENGLVVARGYGLATVSVSSHRDPGVAAGIPVSVSDPDRPETLDWSLSLGTLMNVGDTQTVSASLGPISADTSCVITSSREDIISLSGDTLTALQRGMSVITIQSTYREDLKQEIPIAVTDGTLAMEMPLRRTDASGISENLSRIEAIKQCALDSLKQQNGRGEMSDAEYRRRIKIVESAFEMYAFPWTVDQTVKYWEAANSENGAKDFQPGVIYYGLPYTSGTNHNRTYNVARALEQKRYVPVEGESYYLLNRNVEDYASGYAGNDCSAFVAQALWGYTIYKGEPAKTGTLYYDDRLRAFDDPSELRCGDILVRHSSHVVMFLYWVDEAHTQAVFIQQGGSEPAINTISAYIQDVAYYTEDFYRLRRLAYFD